MLLHDKCAVIYGGAGAVGAASARVFAREGARLFLAGRDLARLDRIARELSAAGASVATAAVDVFAEAAVARHAASVAEAAGGVDVLLNAVGFLHDQGTPLDGLTQDAFMLPVDRFLRAQFILARAFAPHMGGARPGVMLALSAPGARLAAAGHLGHAAASAGIEAFSRTLAAELGPRNVRVVCLRPHALADAPAAGSYTDALFAPKAAAAGLSVDDWLGGAAATTMVGRLPVLAELAETAAFLASDRAGPVTGAVYNMTAGFIAD